MSISRGKVHVNFSKYFYIHTKWLAQITLNSCRSCFSGYLSTPSRISMVKVNSINCKRSCRICSSLAITTTGRLILVCLFLISTIGIAFYTSITFWTIRHKRIDCAIFKVDCISIYILEIIFRREFRSPATAKMELFVINYCFQRLPILYVTGFQNMFQVFETRCL